MLLCSLSNDISTDNIRVVYGLGVKGAEIGAVIWIITIPQTYNHKGIFDILLVLHLSQIALMKQEIPFSTS